MRAENDESDHQQVIGPSIAVPAVSDTTEVEGSSFLFSSRPDKEGAKMHERDTCTSVSEAWSQVPM